jgi:hypothetical protein
MADEEDPLVAALPPATDYLTYLTLIEYQLTPARLPTLHRLLQDETLTINIGWDLVHILLPMLPASQDCLQDIARLGNPREVILRVAESLMGLQPGEEGEEDGKEYRTKEGGEGSDSENHKTPEGISEQSDSAVSASGKTLPPSVMQFNCLVAMLSILHARIKTKSMSRFIATSFQAALEAYTLIPTDETTTTFIELVAQAVPTRRPSVPPRGTSESAIVRVSQISAPDPEAEDDPTSLDEQRLVRRLAQFAVIELLKSYVLAFSGPADPGMAWTLRVQEHLHPDQRLLLEPKKLQGFSNTEHLQERDIIVGKIIALSRDLGIGNDELIDIVQKSASQQPPPLDFEDVPRAPEQIPLERLGSLILLAARFSTALFLSGKNDHRLSLYPDLALVFSKFVGDPHLPEDSSSPQPPILLDSLLALTLIATSEQVESPDDDQQYAKLLLSLTRCTFRSAYNFIRTVPLKIYRSESSQVVRFRLIRTVLENDNLLYAKESAIGWLKSELLPSKGITLQGSSDATADSENIFHNSKYFSILFPLLFNSQDVTAPASSNTNLALTFIHFSQYIAPSIHAALSLYYILLSSPRLLTTLNLSKSYRYFRTQFFDPLRRLCRAFEADLGRNGGDGHIEAMLGDGDMCEVAMARSVGLLAQVTDQVEEALLQVGFHHHHPDDGDDATTLLSTSQEHDDKEESAEVKAIRQNTAPFDFLIYLADR